VGRNPIAATETGWYHWGVFVDGQKREVVSMGLRTWRRASHGISGVRARGHRPSGI